MVTAIDTNILLDVFTNDSTFGAASANALRRCLQEGSLIVCDVVWAETISAFSKKKAFEKAMETLEISYSPLSITAASLAGELWRVACKKRTSVPKRVIADFLVAAHAQDCADRLLTRDRGFYRHYFTNLTIHQPPNPGDAASLPH